MSILPFPALPSRCSQRLPAKPASPGLTNWIIARKGRGLTIAQISPWVSASQGRKWQKHNDGDRIWENR